MVDKSLKMAATPNTKIIRALLEQATVNLKILDTIAIAAMRAGIGDDDKEFVDQIKTAQESARNFIRSIEVVIAAVGDEHHG